MSEERLACVTGASGFIGSHVVRDLLDRGFRVRGTVRDHTDEAKTAHLRKIAEGREDRLELVSANLLEAEPWDAAVAGCDYVFHVASAVFLAAKNPQVEIVDPAVKGTENVFGAIARAGSVKGVGLTSSIAAIAPTERTEDTLTEDDWVEDATLDNNPYGLAKKLAEKAAWRARESLPLESRYEMVVVNPVLVLGPAYARVHLRSSLSVIRDLARGAFKGAPNLGFGIVDVRDVVDALVGGLLAKGKSGRYILHNKFMFMREIAQVIKEEFPELKVPTRRIPNFVMYLAAAFDKRLSWAFLRRNLGRKSNIDNSKVQKDLGIELRSTRESIVATVNSMREHGFV